MKMLFAGAALAVAVLAGATTASARPHPTQLRHTYNLKFAPAATADRRPTTQL